MHGYVKSVDALSDLPTFTERCADAEAHWPKLRRDREEALACAMLARELPEEPASARAWSVMPLAIAFSVAFWIVAIAYLFLYR